MPDKTWLSAKDLSELLEVSLSKSYKLIKVMNTELADRGFLVIPGKVPTAYAKERLYLA